MSNVTRTIKNTILTLFAALGFMYNVGGQEPQVFTWADFDLKGKVSKSTVITAYGREEFEFDSLGYLTKSITRFGAGNYDVTYYRFDGDFLKEKRDESYRDGIIDKQTSIAHFYNLDTVGSRKISESIFSYDKVLLDQYQYIYDDNGRLSRILRANDEGIDETLVEYVQYENEETATYLLNEEVIKTVRTSRKVNENGQEIKGVLTKNFVDGNPDTAVEQEWTPNGKLLREQYFNFDTKTDSFVPMGKILYDYDDDGNLIKQTTLEGESSEVKEYIYQFDKESEGNWVKKIITPDNQYTTRKITYYPGMDPEE